MDPIQRINVWSILVCFLLPAAVGCQRDTAVLRVPEASCGEHFSFVVAADPQLFRGKTEDLKTAVEVVNTLSPDFLFICGDLVESPSNPDQIRACKQAISRLSPDISWYAVPGNHDLGNPVKLKHIQTWQEQFGPLWYHFEHGGCRFVALSSDIFRDRNALLHQEQAVWLVETLERFHSTPGGPVFVFMHHPLFINAPDEADGYSNIPMDICRELLDLFVTYRVRAVFSGHLHDNKVNHYQGIDLITTGSMTVPMGSDPSGIRVVEVDQDGFSSKFLAVCPQANNN